MSKQTKTMAVRLTINQIAKARDGLINKGIAPEHLETKSQILRLAMYLAITANENPEELPSDASLATVIGFSS